MLICVGYPNPFGKSGRNDLSIMRDVNVSKSLGLLSRLKNPPGIFPAAYDFSIYCTVRGKKSSSTTSVSSTTTVAKIIAFLHLTHALPFV